VLQPTTPPFKVHLSFHISRSHHARETKGDPKSLRAFAEAFRLILTVVAVIILEI